MQQHTFWLDTNDHTRIYVNAWLPSADPKALLMLCHGMAEHSERYARFAERLCAEGYGVYAHDQRGHGKTAAQGVAGHFASADGWSKVVGDLSNLAQAVSERHPGKPLFLMGHSMGSFIVQAWLMHHGASLQGAILCGSNYQPAKLYHIARLVARFERLRQGPEGRSALIEWLSFGRFNDGLGKTRTPFDWLSRDPQEVDKYIHDPLCGLRCTNQLWVDLLGGLVRISKPANLAQIDPSLPMLIIGGECDPVSAGKRLKDLAHVLCGVGHQALRLKLYPGARHELLNETNRDEVTRDVLDWLQQALERPRPPRAE